MGDFLFFCMLCSPPTVGCLDPLAPPSPSPTPSPPGWTAARPQSQPPRRVSQMATSGGADRATGRRPRPREGSGTGRGRAPRAALLVEPPSCHMSRKTMKNIYNTVHHYESLYIQDTSKRLHFFGKHRCQFHGVFGVARVFDRFNHDPSVIWLGLWATCHPTVFPRNHGNPPELADFGRHRANPLGVCRSAGSEPMITHLFDPVCFQVLRPKRREAVAVLV